MAILYNQMGTPNPKYQIDVAEHHYIEDCSWLLKQISILDECLECACANFKLEQQIRCNAFPTLNGVPLQRGLSTALLPGESSLFRFGLPAWEPSGGDTYKRCSHRSASETHWFAISNQYVSLPNLRDFAPVSCLLEQPLLAGDECLFIFQHVSNIP